MAAAAAAAAGELVHTCASSGLLRYDILVAAVSQVHKVAVYCHNKLLEQNIQVSERGSTTCVIQCMRAHACLPACLTHPHIMPLTCRAWPPVPVPACSWIHALAVFHCISCGPAPPTGSPLHSPWLSPAHLLVSRVMSWS
jgi:hypothetical protein